MMPKFWKYFLSVISGVLTMSDTKSFTGISETIWNCIRANSQADNRTRYEPADANEGQAITTTAVGEVILHFTFEPAQATLTYSIQEKPFLVTEERIWESIAQRIEQCS